MSGLGPPQWFRDVAPLGDASKSLAALLGEMSRGADAVLCHGALEGVSVSRVPNFLERFGATLGSLVPQSPEGRYVHLVEVGCRQASEAWFPSNENAFAPHTDGAFLDESEVPRVVLLGCTRSAESGGRNFVIHVDAVIELLTQSGGQELLERAQLPFWWETNDGSVVEAPILSTVDGRRCIRFNVARIHDGHARVAGGLDPLESRIVSVIATIDVSAPAASFMLSAGDLLLLQNRHVLHGRAAFVDRPGRRRSLVRVWAR